MVELVDPSTGQAAVRLNLRRKHPLSLAFSQDGRRLAVGLNGQIQIWDVARRERVAAIEHRGLPVLRVALSPDATQLAASSLSNRLWYWDLRNEREPSVIETLNGVKGMAFAPGGHALAVLEKGGRMSVWNLAQASVLGNNVIAREDSK